MQICGTVIELFKSKIELNLLLSLMYVARGGKGIAAAWLRVVLCERQRGEVWSGEAACAWLCIVHGTSSSGTGKSRNCCSLETTLIHRVTTSSVVTTSLKCFLSRLCLVSSSAKGRAARHW